MLSNKPPIMQLLQGGIKNKLFGSYILFYCASIYFFLLFRTDNSLVALLFLTAYYVQSKNKYTY
jgi:hypothetical protein